MTAVRATRANRGLTALSAPQTARAVLTQTLPALAAALDGRGPALLPLPAGPSVPAAVRDDLLTALRPDDPEAPLEADVALVVPTSGSTSFAKGALLTAGAVRASAAATHRRLGGPGQWLLALPLTHVAGLMVLARGLDAGTEPVVLDSSKGFSAAAFAAAMCELGPSRPVYTALVPTQLQRLVDAGVDLARFDAVLLGGAPAPAELVARAGGRIVTTYGMTETCGGCVYDGVPLDGVEVAVGGDGRIRIGGPTVFAGYRLRPDLTAAALVDSQYLTDDLGRLDATGHLEVLGRVDDVVITGGVNVPAGLVAQVVQEHPLVRDCIVVGTPDERWGERLVALVVVADPQLPPTLADLRTFAARRLEPAALPAHLVVVDELPMLASGKPDRVRARALVAAERDGGR